MWDKKNKTVFSYPIKKTKLNKKNQCLGSSVTRCGTLLEYAVSSNVFCRCIYVKLLMPGGAE